MSGRNESARERRRYNIKKQLSLTSVPTSELASEGGGVVSTRRLNLNNHFGWTLLSRTQVGDGNYPHITQFCEKPDISGRDFEKITYVLYMEKGTVIDRDTALKQTQTGDSVLQVPTKPLKSKVTLPPEKPEEPERKKSHPKKKKKMISEFYYVPRDRSHSAKRNKSKQNIVVGDSDVEYEIKKKTPETSKSQLSEIENVLDLEEEKDQAMKEIEKEKEDAMERAKKEVDRGKQDVKDKVKERRKGADRWQLRAGAEHAEAKKTDSKLISSLKFDIYKYGKGLNSEHLLSTPSGTNKYLYVTNDRGRSKQRK